MLVFAQTTISPQPYIDLESVRLSVTLSLNPLIQ